jgi:uncharacterized BrkB/YihY/UPF0761 family membrane protein
MSISAIVILSLWIFLSGFFIITACMLSSRMSQAEELIDYRYCESGTFRKKSMKTKSQSMVQVHTTEAVSFTANIGNGEILTVRD